MTGTIIEADVEEVVLGWLEGLGWSVTYGPDIAPDTLGAECSNYDQVILEQRLCDTILPQIISRELRVKVG